MKLRALHTYDPMTHFRLMMEDESGVDPKVNDAEVEKFIEESPGWFKHMLKEIPHELWDLVVSYFYRTPKVGVDFGVALKDYMKKDDVRTRHNLGRKLLDIAKLPVPYIGFGLASLFFPIMGLSAGALLAGKVYANVAYVLYRVAVKKPKYREFFKKIIPREFMDDDLRKEVEAEEEEMLKQREDEERERKIKERDKNLQFKPQVEMLPYRESKEPRHRSSSLRFPWPQD